MTSAREDQTWFDDHFVVAVDTLRDFLESDGLTFAGKQVADIGCGDGIIDAGVASKLAPAELNGFDVRPTDTDALAKTLQELAGLDGIPENLRFALSSATEIPADRKSFDIVMSWSTFEHVSNPISMLGEIRRIVKDDGVVFIQVWPFFRSEHGGHLWTAVDGSFPHLLRAPHEVEATISDSPRGTDVTRSAVDEWRSLNRIDLDDLQRALLASRLLGTKIELITNAVHVPRELAHLPWSALLIGGVQVLAVPI